MSSVFIRKNVTEQSRIQQQYELHARVTVDALTTRTTTMRDRSRRASPQPGDYSYLSVDAGADLETKKRAAQRASFVATSHTRVYTQQQQQYVGHRGGLGCLKKKTSESASARLFAARLESVSAGSDARVQARAKCTRRGARHNSK